MSSNQSRSRNTFAALMNATAAITGQRTPESEPPLPLTESDIINVDKFKVSEVNDSTINPPCFTLEFTLEYTKPLDISTL